ncbi:3'-5' exoribonuclease [Pseudomonas sp. N3-W]|uniref:3'-5' exoribonuclease n=1 Tax=Pseudomonas sp. N3-W TaxID=2975049 RepID=UPI00217D80C1|nr:3'-5' exoribonuclease [Pseudomonas sp. N3-W]UWF48385.1 3'-5' exoribonuclease [Pseudomonas sp. N3-W]
MPSVVGSILEKLSSGENESVKLFLDCEFTQLNQDTKLISLALVSETDDEFYVELTDTYQVEDCSEFVIQNVLPQLDLPIYGMSLVEAQASLRTFLDAIEGPLEICTDAPDWDWDFFCQLAYVNHRWPSHVVNRPTNLIQLLRHIEADDIGDVALPELPHQALLDARLLSGLYRRLSTVSKQAGGDCDDF